MGKRFPNGSPFFPRNSATFASVKNPVPRVEPGLHAP